MIVFDIETGPLPDDVLRKRTKPFEPEPHPGEFHAVSVKVGNMKDEAKIKEKIDKAKQVHNALVAKHETEAATAKEEWWQKIVGKAALSPITGQVLAIGYQSTDTGKSILDIGEETKLVHQFWFLYKNWRTNNRLAVGHNIFGFDLPFLVRRSWLLGEDVPPELFDRGRFIEQKTFVDTMKLWSCGSHDMIGLGNLAGLLGIGGKPEGVDGGMFAELLKTDRPKAEAYLRNDLEMTAKVAERMGLI